MEPIVDYRVLLADTTEELTATVVKELAEGWQPLGGPLSLPAGRLAQAMIRTDPGPTAAAAERLLAEDGVGSMDTAQTHVIVRGQNLTDRQR
jgi:hypothetical protein